ncbi:MAG: hypothetical protein ACK5YD_04280 [Phenylobacterium sp.]
MATPSISTGIYRYPLAEATAIALQTAREHGAPEIMIDCVCLDDATHDA